MTLQIHYLKCHPVYFDASVRGEKPFDVRRNDRGFQKGDLVVLQRTHPDRLDEIELNYDGKAKYAFTFRIGYILTGGQFGIQPGYVVLGHDLTFEAEVAND